MADPSDPLHAIYGMRPRSLLLPSVGAGQGQIATDRSIPLLPLAVPLLHAPNLPQAPLGYESLEHRSKVFSDRN
jgi:hypothetical protein